MSIASHIVTSYDDFFAIQSTEKKIEGGFRLRVVLCKCIGDSGTSDIKLEAIIGRFTIGYAEIAFTGYVTLFS